MGSISPHPNQYLLLSIFFIIAILIVMNQYLIVLIYISLMSYDIEHLFMCLLVMYIFLKCLFRILFLIWNWVFFVLLSYKNSFLYSGYKSLTRYMIYKCFLSGCLFILLMESLEAQKLLILMKSILSIFSLVSCAFSVISKKLLPNLRL